MAEIPSRPVTSPNRTSSADRQADDRPDAVNQSSATALAYAELGWHVFPCKPTKAPYTKHGFKDATTDPEQIASWWRKWPSAQIGVACGPSGVVVIDTDIDKEKGLDGEAALAAHVGPESMDAVLEATTPRGGRHRFYANPNGEFGNTTAMLDGVDVRGDGGYVIVPSPSSPNREWDAGDPLDGEQLEPPPPCIADILPRRNRPAGSRTKGMERPVGDIVAPRSPDDVVLRRTASALWATPATIGRSEWLPAILGAHAALDGDPRGAQLVEAWSATSTVLGQHKPGEAAAIYRAARDPDAIRAVGGSPVDEGTLFAMAQRHGWNPPEVELPAFLEGATTPQEAPLTFVAGIDPLLEPGMLSRVPQPRPYLLRHATKDGKPVPPGGTGDGFASMGIAGLLLAEGGAGKTQCILALAVSVATGHDWLGFRVDPEFAGRRVLLVLAEETTDEVHRRLHAIAEHQQLTEAERRAVEDRVLVFALAGTDYPTALAALDPKGCPQPTNTLTELLERVRAADEPWGLIALDPLARLFPEAESSNALATFATQQVERLVRSPGEPLVMFAHHSSKAARTSGQTDSRGVTGLSDACRWALTLTSKQGGTVELMQAKANYSAPWSAPVVLHREAFGILRRASAEELAADTDERDRRLADGIEADARAAVEALRGKRAGTRNGIATHMRRRAKDVLPGIRLAIDDERIVQVRLPDGKFYVVAEDAEDADRKPEASEPSGAGADSDTRADDRGERKPPYTPGKREAACPPVGGGKQPHASGFREGDGKREAADIDDGIPEKPQGRRRRRKAKDASEASAALPLTDSTERDATRRDKPTPGPSEVEDTVLPDLDTEQPKPPRNPKKRRRSK